VARWGFDTPQPDLFSVSNRQDHIRQFDLRQFLKDLPGLISNATLATQSRQCLAEHVSQKTNQNMSRDTLLFLMPYGTNSQITFMNSKGFFRLR
jgi:hypothetical protein